MLILGLLDMYFDAVVFVTKSSLWFRLVVAILCVLQTASSNRREDVGEIILAAQLFRPALMRSVVLAIFSSPKWNRIFEVYFYKNLIIWIYSNLVRSSLAEWSKTSKRIAFMLLPNGIILFFLSYSKFWKEQWIS